MSIKWKRMTDLRRRQWVGILDKLPLKAGIREMALAQLPQPGAVYKIHKDSIGQKILGGVKKFASKETLRFGGMMLGIGTGLFASWLTRAVVGAGIYYGRKSKMIQGSKLARALKPFTWGFGAASAIRAVQLLGGGFERGGWLPTPSNIDAFFQDELGVRRFPGVED